MSADLDNRFDYHRPDDAKAAVHEQVRGAHKQLAETLDGLLPAGREKSLVVTNLEQAMFWANAAVARNDLPADTAAAPSQAYRLQVFPGDDGQFYVRIVAGNNQRLFVSEGYTRHEDAARAAETAKAALRSVVLDTDQPS